MDFTDKATFAKEMERMARLVTRKTETDEIDSYFKYLQDYKIETIGRAIDKAYRDRDPDDVYLKTKMLSANEIKFAADDILKIEGGEKDFGCSKCIGGWVVMKRSDAQPIAHRCECLLARIDERKKGGNQRRRA